MSSQDQENSRIVLTVRELNPAVPIVALAESEDSIDVLELSGATHVLPLAQQMGEHLANRVNAGSAHTNVIGGVRGLPLAEFPVAATPFEARSVAQLGLREELGITVVGVWQRGQLVPALPDMVLSSHCAKEAQSAAWAAKFADRCVVGMRPTVPCWRRRAS